MATKFIVATYLCDRAFGGPEEGGWYYDCGELVRVHRIFGNEDAAYDFAARMNRTLDATINRDRPKISSVLSEGRFYACVHENNAPKYYPEERPHYE